MDFSRQSLRILLASTIVSVGISVSAPTAAAQQCVSKGKLDAISAWPHNLLQPEKLWPLTTGNGQRVAVIGTGVADTQYLSERIVASVDLAPKEPSAKRRKSADCLGVGTGVAGVIAGQRGPNSRFSGLAPGTEILSAKVIGDELPRTSRPGGSVAPSTLAEAIDWAVDHRANVIAVTAVGTDSAQLQRAVRKALDTGAVVVASVGDGGPQDPDLVPFPAGYTGVIGVGAIGAEGTAAPFSGARGVDLVAPGADIVTTYPGGGLGRVSGTAFATGYVAATAALVRAYRPRLSPAEVSRRLLATATPAPEGQASARYGSGIVSPYHAVLDIVGAGRPAALPPATQASSRSHGFDRPSTSSHTYPLIVGGLAIAVLIAAGLVFGRRGRDRRWRSGLASIPREPVEPERPAPPVELFADQPGAER